MMMQVVEEGSWSVMGYSIALQFWEDGCTLDEIDFFRIFFRVQIHNLLPEMLTRSNAERIGNLGKVVEVKDLKLIEGGREFLIIIVTFEASKTLVERF
ncbi:hypothetical protein DITRI_Ditri09bG0083000 [Diplodiscus trichospermus]